MSSEPAPTATKTSPEYGSATYTLRKGFVTELTRRERLYVYTYVNCKVSYISEEPIRNQERVVPQKEVKQ